MSRRKKVVIGWVILIAAIIVSFIIDLRGTLFYGEPLNQANLIMTAIVAGPGTAVYIAATREKKEQGKK